MKRFVDDAELFRAEHADAPRSIAVQEAPYELLPRIAVDRPVDGRLPDATTEIADWQGIMRLSSESVVGNCPDLKSWLSDRAILADDESIASLARGDEWGAHVLSIAMPVFIDDQKQAVVFARKGTGGLAGVGLVATYSEGPHGEWQFVGEEVRWVS